jgi:L-alanine-DL-glutamate epimerase-like enolase superfamily enzyme
MKITEIAIECYSAPLPATISNARYTYATSDRCIVRVATDEGITGVGVGDGGTGLAAGPRMIAATVQSLRPVLIGQDALAVGRLWQRMWNPKLIGRRGFTTRVISAVDIALWDLRAKTFGVPVGVLLGGCHTRVAAYVAGGYYAPDKGLQDLASEMAGYVEQGAQAVKMKVGGASVPEDIRRVAAVRAAVGPGTRLLVDANNGYRVYEAVQLARRLEELDVYWLEEPVMPDNYRGLREVGRATVIPVASGENEYTRYGFRDLLELGQPGILNPDVQFVGGVTEFMKVAALAQAHDIPVAPHGYHDLHIQLAAAIPNALLVEYNPPERDPLVSAMQVNRLTLTDGSISPPDAPGFGLVMDETALASYRVL